VPGRDEKRHQPPPDGSARSGKKNAHVDPPLSSNAAAPAKSGWRLTRQSAIGGQI
jgi:hypothetical protein